MTDWSGYMRHVLGDIDVRTKGAWVVRKDSAGITHLLWMWHGNRTMTYLCCANPEWLEWLRFPVPDQEVTCCVCIGTVVS